MTLKVIPVLQAFSSAIRRTFVQYFTRFQLTARSRGPSATAGLLVFIGEVALGYYGRRIIVTPFVNQQVFRLWNEVEQFSSLSSSLQEKTSPQPAGTALTDDHTPCTQHAAARPSMFFFTWPSTCFRGPPFICGRSRSTQRTACRI